jgi:acyl carrier protein
MPATITKEQVEQRVVEVLVSFGAERDTITRDAEWEPLGIDSLDLVELAQIVEDEYGVQMREEDMTQLLTVGQAIDFVTARAGS